jgi:hypothetical protein
VGGAPPGREAMAMTVMGMGMGLGGIIGGRGRGTLPAAARTKRTTADDVGMMAATEGAAGAMAALWTSGVMAALRTGGAMTRVAAGGHPVGARMTQQLRWRGPMGGPLLAVLSGMTRSWQYCRLIAPPFCPMCGIQCWWS